MKLKEVISYIQNSEIDSLAQKNDLKRLCLLINLGLDNLHKRLNIKQAEIIIPLEPGKYEYDLNDYIKENKDEI
jgi:uncharacterized protein YeeX (DUF496 family)